VPSREDFPDHVTLGSIPRPLAYVHKTGDEQDGITLRLPVEGLGQLDARRLECAVPGHLREKVETIVRGRSRRTSVACCPAQGPLAERFLTQGLPFGEGDLFELLAACIDKAASVEVPVDVLRAVSLPSTSGSASRCSTPGGRWSSPAGIWPPCGPVSPPRLRRPALQSSSDRYRRDGIEVCGRGRHSRTHRGSGVLGVKVIAASRATVDQGSSAGLRLFDSPSAGRAVAPRRVRRLYMLDCGNDLRRYSTQLHGIERMAAWFTPSGHRRSFVRRCRNSSRIAPSSATSRPFATPGYFERRGQGLDRLGTAVRECCDLVAQVLALFIRCRCSSPARRPSNGPRR
jgi:ATP-dependent helicase HrpA